MAITYVVKFDELIKFLAEYGRAAERDPVWAQARLLTLGIVSAVDTCLVWTNDGYDAVYVNGELKDSGHGLSEQHVLTAMGIEFKSVHWNEKQAEKMGTPPQQLKNLKVEKE